MSTDIIVELPEKKVIENYFMPRAIASLYRSKNNVTVSNHPPHKEFVMLLHIYCTNVLKVKLYRNT